MNYDRGDGKVISVLHARFPAATRGVKQWGYRWPMILGVVIISLSTTLLGDQRFRLFSMIGIHFGEAETLAILMMVTGAGMG